MTQYPRRLLVMAAATAVTVAWATGHAQQSHTVDNVIINLGLVPAEVALAADGHRDAHPLHPPAGSEHVLVTLDAAPTHARIGDADVRVDIVDPHGIVESKHLLHTQSGGLADYSELFHFRWSGQYHIRAVITPAHSGHVIETAFDVHHVI